MTPRVLGLSALGAVVVVVVALASGAGRRRASPRSQHSQPARVIWTQTVVADTAGAIFHAAGCPFLHGRAPRRLGMAAAVAQGYAPCVRCMHAALGR